jgi:glycosyltransferase involved in cell wall biosynthesis
VQVKSILHNHPEVDVEALEDCRTKTESGIEGSIRVAIFTETFLPKVDGVVTRLCQTLRHLHRMGHSVLLIAPKGVTEFEGVPVHGVPAVDFPLYPDLKAGIPNPQIGKVIRAFNPDLIHALNPAILGVSAFFVSTSLHRPLVVSYHTHLTKYLGYYGLGRLEPLMWWGLRAGYNRADLNLVTSKAMQTELENHGIQRVQLWPRGVDTELFHPRRASAKMRDRLSEGYPEDKLLLYVGRLAAEKEVERCRDILQAFPGVRLAVVGDGPHRQRLEQYFAGMPAHFEGYLKGVDLAEAYASVDAVFLPSRTEALGLVLLEAMAAGCPVVAPRAGGVTDIVRDGVTGYLYDPTEPDAAVAAHKRLLFDSAHRRLISSQAREDAEQWGWEAATRELERHYRSVMEMERLLPHQIAACSALHSSPPAICEELQISKATFRRHATSRNGANSG